MAMKRNEMPGLLSNMAGFRCSDWKFLAHFTPFIHGFTVTSYLRSSEVTIAGCFCSTAMQICSTSHSSTADESICQVKVHGLHLVGRTNCWGMDHLCRQENKTL